MYTTVVEAVTVEVASLAKRDKAAPGSSMAALALALAREVDAEGNSATSKSMCARALIEAMTRLRESLPAEKTSDQLDEIAKRRDARKARTVAK